MKRGGVYLGLTALALMVLGSGMTCHYRETARTSEALANEAKGEARAAADQARITDSKVVEVSRQVADAHAETERLRRKLAATPRPASNGGAAVVPEPGALPVCPDCVARDIYIQDQDALIQAQDRELVSQRALTVDLTNARDAWKRSADSSGREALQLRASLAAREGLEKSALWKGRIQGFAVGIGSGFIAGRIR